MTKKKTQPERRQPFRETGSRAVDDFTARADVNPSGADTMSDRVKDVMENLPKKQAERNRVRWTVDLSRYSEYELDKKVERLALEHEVPPGNIMALFIKRGLDDIKAGELHLEDFYMSNDHPRVKRVLALEKPE